MGITYTQVNSSEIERLVDRIENVVEGEHRVHTSIACFIIAILAQKPDLEPEKLQEAVKGVSEYLAALLAPVESIN